MTDIKQYLGIDQYGNTYHFYGRSRTIRKSLLEKIGYKSTKKQYIDDNESNSYHIGYVCTLRGEPRLWITIYELIPMRVKI